MILWSPIALYPCKPAHFTCTLKHHYLDFHPPFGVDSETEKQSSSIVLICILSEVCCTYNTLSFIEPANIVIMSYLFKFVHSNYPLHLDVGCVVYHR